MKRKNTTPSTTTFTATEPIGVCGFCGEPIEKGRRAMSSFDGTGDFVHVTCWDKNWDSHMQQKRDEFEQEILNNNTTVKP
jgi:hypothetical protein